MFLRGPLIVVVSSRGVIQACFFHLSRAAAERRAETMVSTCKHFGRVTAKIYVLGELVRLYDEQEERDVQELERMMGEKEGAR